jgi:hypothetical protein
VQPLKLKLFKRPFYYNLHANWIPSSHQHLFKVLRNLLKGYTSPSTHSSHSSSQNVIKSMEIKSRRCIVGLLNLLYSTLPYFTGPDLTWTDLGKWEIYISNCQAKFICQKWTKSAKGQGRQHSRFWSLNTLLLYIRTPFFCPGWKRER